MENRKLENSSVLRLKSLIGQKVIVYTKNNLEFQGILVEIDSAINLTIDNQIIKGSAVKFIDLSDCDH